MVEPVVVEVTLGSERHLWFRSSLSTVLCRTGELLSGGIIEICYFLKNPTEISGIFCVEIKFILKLVGLNSDV